MNGEVMMNTYAAMNERISRLLRFSDDPMRLYAAKRIEELEAKCSHLASKIPGSIDYSLAWDQLKDELRKLEVENTRLKAALAEEEKADAEIQEMLAEILESHRAGIVSCCAEDCLCWDVEAVLDFMESGAAVAERNET